MRARLGIDKTKSWADWVEEEEEAALAATAVLATAKLKSGSPEKMIYLETAAETTALPTTVSAAAKPAAAEPAALLLSMRLRGGAAECESGQESGEESGDERERAAHAERQRQQPPEMLIDFESLRKLERKAERMGYSAAAYWDERVEEAKEICPEWLAELRREFDGETRLTAENSALGSEAPSLRNYRNKAKRTRDSLPARFYRMIEGEEWDGEAHSYSKARKKYRRWEEPYQQRERERQQRKKRDYSKKKRPADDNARRQARRSSASRTSSRR